MTRWRGGISDHDPGVVTAELHVVDPGSAAVQNLGPVGTEAQAPAWWNHNDVWHLAHLAVSPGHVVGGLAVLDTVPSAAGPAAEHRDLTGGMSVCPTELVQVADGPPLALFADGLDTALYRLDPESLRFCRLSSAPGTLAGLTVSRTGETCALSASGGLPAQSPRRLGTRPRVRRHGPGRGRRR